MSGHSKWSTIKRKKAAIDQKRGKIFSKLAKEISVAASIAGGDPDMNPRLRTVLLACRSANMPKDKIDAAIKKGTGEDGASSYEEARYEAYGPGGVALVIDALTDNKNRTVADVRHAVTKLGGSLAETGAVTWNFDTLGYIALPKEAGNEEEIFEKAIEAGADDVRTEGDVYEIFTDPTALHEVSAALEEMGIEAEEAKLTLQPKTTVEIEGSNAKTLFKMIEMLEDLDDIQNVYSNFEMSDEAMAAAMAD